MDHDHMRHFENLIRNRLATLATEDATSADARATVTLDQQSVGRLSRMDALQQQAMAAATHRRRTQERAQLIAALARIADGSYGICTDCDEDIPPARLEAAPAIQRCVGCIRGT